MMMIVTALYCEAEPFIHFFNLQKDPCRDPFQIYRKPQTSSSISDGFQCTASPSENHDIFYKEKRRMFRSGERVPAEDDVFLLVTNPGTVSAAIGVTYLCSHHAPGPSDLLVNIGICGAANRNTPIGSVYLGHKIYDFATKRCFYPDMLFAHPFFEDGIVSCASVAHENECDALPENLVDMEAAGIYQAGSTFIRPDQMVFIKIVSDHLEGEQMKPEKVSCLLQNNLPAITGWLLSLQSGLAAKAPFFTPEEERALAWITENLHCSVSMLHQLRRIMHYYKLQHGSILDPVDVFLKANQPLPCKTKKEGKECFERLKKEFIEPVLFPYLY